MVCTPVWRHAHALARGAAAGHYRSAMEIVRAQLIAERLHADDREEDMPLLNHIGGSFASSTPTPRPWRGCTRPSEWTVVTEHELLMEGVDSEELRALRLLRRTHDSRSDRVYLAHLGLIARSAGRAGGLARLVKIADLRDRCLHPRVRADGWSPPYARPGPAQGSTRSSAWCRQPRLPCSRYRRATRECSSRRSCR